MNSMLTLRGLNNQQGSILAINAPYYEPKFTENNGKLNISWVAKYANGMVPTELNYNSTWQLSDYYNIICVEDYPTLFYSLNEDTLKNIEVNNIYQEEEIKTIDEIIFKSEEEIQSYLRNREEKQVGIYRCILLNEEEESQQEVFCIYLEDTSISDIFQSNEFNTKNNYLFNLWQNNGYYSIMLSKKEIAVFYKNNESCDSIIKMDKKDLAANNFYYDKNTSILYYYTLLNDEDYSNYLDFSTEPYQDKRLVSLTNPNQGSGVEIVESINSIEEKKENIPYFTSDTQDIYTFKKDENENLIKTRYTHKIYVVETGEELANISAQAQSGDLVLLLDNKTDQTDEAYTYCEEYAFGSSGEGEEQL